MNNPASNKESSKHSKSIKQSHRVEAQLARLEKAKDEVVAETLTTPASAIELIPASALPPVEKVHVEAETAEPVEIVSELQPRNVEQVDRKMLGKIKRAFLKAGVEAGSEAQAAFLNELLMADVPVLNRSSGRIARVVKGEENIATLLLVRAPKKST
jgi:K+ transporter